ncbi:MAG: hypothetical protein JSV09_01140 [Thermoplasmata archaeon]|nr:MAG: hypothetical protein JSV09_01140 [Thermoplasmata archaeon]
MERDDLSLESKKTTFDKGRDSSMFQNRTLFKYKPQEVEITKGQKIFAYFCIIVGLSVLIILPIGLVIRGIPPTDSGIYAIIVGPTMALVLVLFGINILKSKGPITITRWDLGKGKQR